MPADGQPEAGPPVVPGRGRIPLPESGEEATDLLRRHPDSGVANGEKDVVAAVVPKDPDLAAFDVQGLYRLCRQKLEASVVPSYIQLLHQIPKTASEKPQDRFLIEAFASNPGAVHTEAR